MDAFYNIGSWVYVVGAVVLLALLLLFLWFRIQFNTKKIERDLKMIESQYQDKFMEEHRSFIEKQETYIRDRLKELELKECGLAKNLSTIEEDNIKKLHELLEKFEKKIANLQEEREKESEKKIHALQEKYEKRIQDLEEKNARETEALKKDRAKILRELEEYQKDLEQKSKNELKKIRDRYEQEMKSLQKENTKLLDEMQRMLQARQKAQQPPPPLPSPTYTPKESELRFSDESLSKIEKQIESTTEEMERLKNQFIEIEKKRHEEFEVAQTEIEALKFKIKYGEIRG